MATRSFIATSNGSTTFGIVASIDYARTLSRLGPADAHIEIRTVKGATAAQDTWVEVNCQITLARATWGSSRSLGVLTTAEGGSLELEVYDPARLLDPANRNSPYWGKLIPGLRIRLRYAEVLVKEVAADTITHTMITKVGRISGNDMVSFLSGFKMAEYFISQIPEYHITIADVANNVISVTGLAGRLTTEANSLAAGSDDSFGNTTSNVTKGTAWGQIEQACIDNLYFPWIDATNKIRYRDATVAALPGISLGLHGPKPLEFIAAIDMANVYTVVRASSAAEGIWASNHAVGFPLYGEIAYERLGRKLFGRYTTPLWTDPVVQDRGMPTLEAVPLRIWPASDAEMRSLLNVVPMDRVIMEFDTVTPPFTMYGRAIGGAVSVDPDGWSVELTTEIAAVDNP